MNDMLIIKLLDTYSIVNDGSLTIVTDDKVFNNCYVNDLDLNFVHITDKDDKLFHIKIDDIIGIQFQD